MIKYILLTKLQKNTNEKKKIIVRLGNAIYFIAY